MGKIGITTIEDIGAFFNAYNKRQYNVLFEKYMSEDCFWYASEKKLHGKKEILNYWTNYHSAFSEMLGTPEHVVFSDGHIYLQVKIRLDFIEDGSFFGKVYKKGDICQFECVDYYELNEEGKICSCFVYIRFFNNED